MRASVVALVCLLTATLQVARAGVIIGNPPQWRVATESGTGGATLRSLTTTVIGVELFGCSPGVTSFVVGEEAVDFVAGFTPVLPEGEWCAMTLHLGTTLVACYDAGCDEQDPGLIDLETTGDITLRGVIIGNPPLRAVPPS